MPRLALGLCVVWFASLFVFRTFVQWRRTGSTGLKGFHGRVGSLPWIAGTTVSLGFLLTPAAPLAALFGGPGSALVFSSAPVHLAGAVWVVVGLVGALAAQLSMGDSWRVGVDESEKTKLVVDGLFAWVRNPIFSFMGLSVLGLVLLVPNLLAALACLLTIVGIELQVRAVEEPFLEKTHGEAYARYVAAVGRFVPRVAKRTSAPERER
jgi:protein-S-isoprenylcysteine O-methyltransferase Ste14